MAPPSDHEAPSGYAPEVPTSPTSPSEPKVPSAPSSAAPAGVVRRVGLASVKPTTPSAPDEVLKQFHTENRPLDQEGLERAWAEAVSQLPDTLSKVQERVKGLVPHLDNEDDFTINVSNSFVEAEIRPGMIPILTHLRNHTGRSNLNGHIKVVYEEKESIVYAPRDKYDVMVKENPVLDTFKVIFPDVDY